MALNTGIDPKTVSYSDLRFQPDKTKPNLAYLLDDVYEIAAGTFYGIFNVGSIKGASWVGSRDGNDDAGKVARELNMPGSKDKGISAQRKAWINVAVKNSDGTYSVKVWEAANGIHETVYGFFKEGVDLPGMPISVAFASNKWTVQPALGAKAKRIEGAELDELRAQRMDGEALQKFLGPETEADIRAMLVKRAGVPNWNGVRELRGLPAIELGGEYEEYA